MSILNTIIESAQNVLRNTISFLNNFESYYILYLIAAMILSGMIAGDGKARQGTLVTAIIVCVISVWFIGNYATFGDFFSNVKLKK